MKQNILVTSAPLFFTANVIFMHFPHFQQMFMIIFWTKKSCHIWRNGNPKGIVAANMQVCLLSCNLCYKVKQTGYKLIQNHYYARSSNGCEYCSSCYDEEFHDSQVLDNQHTVKYSSLGHKYLHAICAYVH